MKRAVALIGALGLLALAGCSAAPSRETVAERFLIEYTDNDAYRDAMQEVADQLADEALDGRCGDDGFETGLQTSADEDLFYAWRSTCLMYFEDDLSAGQVNETKRMVAERAANG